MLDKSEVNYTRVTIVQEYDLKERLEELGIKREVVTIASVDAINIRPSIKIATIKKAVRLFTKEFITSTKKKINLCLELICFDMRSNLISLYREY